MIFSNFFQKLTNKIYTEIKYLIDISPMTESENYGVDVFIEDDLWLTLNVLTRVGMKIHLFDFQLFFIHIKSNGFKCDKKALVQIWE